MRVLLMLRGAPGCGKSTWIRENGLEKYALSADTIRMMCAGPSMAPDGTIGIDQKNDQTVWKMLFQLLEVRMRNGEFTVIDATNSKTSEMNRYKELCDTFKYRMYCVDMTDIPLETVKERNAWREPLKRVPEAAIDRIYSRFATQKIPSGIKVIRPDELSQVFLRQIDLSEYEKIHVIGDIHGCNTALQEYLGEGLHDREFYIFVGDYIDRGIENAAVIRFLCEIKDQKNVLLLEGNHERWLWVWGNGGICESKEFELHTRGELENEGIERKDVRQLYRRMGQCAWFSYHGKQFLVTHGGLSALPANLSLVSSRQMIHGVGSYNDFDQVEASWLTGSPADCYQIHGHRNTKGVGVRANERCFNLEGSVEFGGCLRAVQILPDGDFETFEIRNRVFREPDTKPENPEPSAQKNIGDIILDLRRNRFIQEKQYGNISSFNFTKSAFYDKVWDDMTTKARGLYINVPKEKVTARAYEKFFNINERPETELESLRYRLAFPVNCYVKENGFLGIAAWNEEDDSLFVTTKSSPEGDFAVWLREDMEELFGREKLDEIKAYSREHNVSFVFECVDMKRDPHIIEYPENRIYLLDVVSNTLEFQKLPYDELTQLADKIGLRCKEHAYTLETWQDFFDWYYSVLDEDYLYHGREIEGFVIEDYTWYMVKLKLTYYNFWKFMRGVAHETLRKGYIDPRRTSALTTPLANYFYGWLKELYTAGKEQDNLDQIPRDIVTLRNLFFSSHPEFRQTNA